MMTFLTRAFGLVVTLAVALSLAAGLLVTASLFIADRAPQSPVFLGIHLVVSGIFLVTGLLLAGIGVQVVGIAKIAATAEAPSADRLRTRVARLLVLLVIAGLGLGGMLALVTHGILSRIDEGFAVFG